MKDLVYLNVVCENNIFARGNVFVKKKIVPAFCRYRIQHAKQIAEFHGENTLELHSMAKHLHRYKCLQAYHSTRALALCSPSPEIIICKPIAAILTAACKIFGWMQDMSYQMTFFHYTKESGYLYTRVLTYPKN